LLGLPSEGAETYSTAIIDKNGKYYFIINPEIAQLVDLTKCVSYDQIQFNIER
jgi:hypothetical protein